MTIYLIWQLVYYELIVIRKKSKIETGERINSYSTMSKGKGPVANLLGKAPPKRREPAFMRKFLPIPFFFFSFCFVDGEVLTVDLNLTMSFEGKQCCSSSTPLSPPYRLRLSSIRAPRRVRCSCKYTLPPPSFAFLSRLHLCSLSLPLYSILSISCTARIWRGIARAFSW